MIDFCIGFLFLVSGVLFIFPDLRDLENVFVDAVVGRGLILLGLFYNGLRNSRVFGLRFHLGFCNF